MCQVWIEMCHKRKTYAWFYRQDKEQLKRIVLSVSPRDFKSQTWINICAGQGWSGSSKTLLCVHTCLLNQCSSPFCFLFEICQRYVAFRIFQRFFPCSICFESGEKQSKTQYHYHHQCQQEESPQPSKLGRLVRRFGSKWGGAGKG